MYELCGKFGVKIIATRVVALLLIGHRVVVLILYDAYVLIVDVDEVLELL